ncbi:MAG: hypothetical protein II041_02495 [Bacteroidales bacterium]|nr:hypothetical protein [Bacteroidales bacterium]
MEGLFGWRSDDTIRLSLDLRSDNGFNRLFLSSSAKKQAAGQSMRLYLTFISPSDNVYRDTLSLTFEKTEGGEMMDKGGKIQIQWPYMEIGRLSENGRWTILLQREEEENPAYSQIYGMGISVSN